MGKYVGMQHDVHMYGCVFANEGQSKTTVTTASRNNMDDIASKRDPLRDEGLLVRGLLRLI